MCVWEWPFAEFADACSSRRDLSTDRAALLELYARLDGPSWKRRDGWDESSEVTTWFGVSVVGGRVVMVRLPDNGLRGELPARALDKLDKLKWLDVAKNPGVTGEVPPPEMLRCVEWLNISGCELAGNVPKGLSSIGVVRRGDHERTATALMAFNDHPTEPWLPPAAELAALNDLFALAACGREGAVERCWRGVTVLDGHVRGVCCRGCGLRGELPASLCVLARVSDVDLADNALSGALPAGAFGQYASVQAFDVSNNLLCGPVPRALIARGDALRALSLSGVGEDTNDFEDAGSVLMTTCARHPFLAPRDALLAIHRLPKHEDALADDMLWVVRA